jgi:hypothetical protein
MQHLFYTPQVLGRTRSQFILAGKSWERRSLFILTGGSGVLAPSQATLKSEIEI